jgi:hypothetical protein
VKFRPLKLFFAPEIIPHLATSISREVYDGESTSALSAGTNLAFDLLSRIENIAHRGDAGGAASQMCLDSRGSCPYDTTLS